MFLVFFTNISELQNTIKEIYGIQFNATRYLDKFFDIILSLPPLEIEAYLQSLGIKTGETSPIFEHIKFQIIKNFHFEIREINHFLRLTEISNGMLRKTNKPFYDNEKYWYLMINCIAPLLIALKMTDREKYESFINGENPATFTDLMMENRIAKYFRLKTERSDDIRSGKDVTKTLYEHIFKKPFKEGASLIIDDMIIKGNGAAKLVNKKFKPFFGMGKFGTGKNSLLNHIKKENHRPNLMSS